MTIAEVVRSRWRELRRHPAFQAALIYAGASWAIVQVADIFFPTLGLSDRAIGWLGIVLVIGFAITVAVAWQLSRTPSGAAATAGDDVGVAVEPSAEGAPGAEAAGAEGPEGGELAGPAARARRRRRLVYAAATALVALGAGLWWIGPRFLTGAVAPEAETIAVLPFNTSGSGVDLLGEGMVDLMSTNLDGVGGIRTVDPRTVLHRWRQRAGGAGLDLDGALAVGRDVDAGSVLLGSVVSAGAEVRLTAELHAVRGPELARVRVDGPPDSVLALVDSLSLRLLREIWRSREPIPDLRVAAITTGSVDAIRAYLRGEQFYRRSDWDSAVAAFREAVAHDSTFALAQYRLGLTYGWSAGHGSESARRHADAALRHIERLPVRERSLVVAHQQFEQGSLAALDTMERYVERYPDDTEGWYLLGDVRYHAQPLIALPPDSLLAAFERVIELDPSLTPALIHPLEVSLSFADSARFERYLELFRGGAPAEQIRGYELERAVVWGPTDSVMPALYELLSAVGRQEISGHVLGGLIRLAYRSPDVSPALIAAGMAAVDDPTLDDAVRSQFRVARASILTSLGQLARARPLIDSIAAESKFTAAGLYLRPVIAGYAPASFVDSDLLNEVTGSADGGVEYAVAGLFQTMFLLSKGNSAAARATIDSLRGADPMSTQPFTGLLTAAGGWADLVDGDTLAAIGKLESGLESAGYGSLPISLGAPMRFQWAVAMSERPETRAVGIHGLRYATLYHYPDFIPLAYRAIGVALEAAGDEEGAARAYGQFIRLWEDADPELQPPVDAARRALRRLTEERESAGR